MSAPDVDLLAAKLAVSKGECNGSCDTHIGEPVLCNVSGWGWFSYCKEAQLEDVRRGLRVCVEAAIDAAIKANP